MSSPRFVIRRAEPEDGPAVREFVFATLRSYGIEPDPAGLDADVMAFGTAGGGPVAEFVAEVEGKVAGSVALSPRGGGAESQALAQGAAEAGISGDPALRTGRVNAPGSDKAAWLSKLFVDATYRGRGLGRALLARAVDEARVRGYRRIDLETRTTYREAVRLYESTGWVRGPDLPPEHGPDRTYSLHLA